MDEKLTLLTEEMEQEEKQIEEINEMEGEEMKTKMEEKAAMDEELLEQRHKRLMHLLTKSEFYSRYVLKKMNAENEDDNNNRKRMKMEFNDDKENSDSGSQVSPKRMSTRQENSLSDIVDERIKAVEYETREEFMPSETQPELFENGTLRSYQLEGFKWLKTLFENGINGILADEMGLGKTIQIIAMICHLVHMDVAGPFLVVAPLSTLPNWISEFKRFSPKIPVMLLHGTKEERKKRLKKIKTSCRIRGMKKRCFPVVITSFEVSVRDIRDLKKIMWRYLAVDEGHRLKNHKCLLAKALCSLTSTNRVILTGTPLQNNLAELWSLLNFLLPDIFDNLDIFESWFEIEDMMGTGANEKIVEQEREKQIVSTLHKILNPFLLRRVKADVDLQIPPKKELLVYVPMTQLQFDLYKATITRDFSDFKEFDQKSEIECSEKDRPKRNSKKRFNLPVLLNDSESNEAFEEYLEEAVKNTAEEEKRAMIKELKPFEVKLNLRNVMMQCRKVVNHPYLLRYPLTSEGEYKIDEDLLKQCGKLQVLDQLLVKLYERKHRVLLFSQMTQLLNIIEDYLFLRPQFKYKRLDGRVKIEDRTSDIMAFNQGECFLYLLSTRAGGLGINLASADTVIIYDSDWNPQQDLQAQDRCHRIGQTKPVLVLRLVAASTIDQQIVERAATKRKLEKMIMKSGKFRSCNYEERKMENEINPEELLKLLQSSDHHRIHKATNGDGVFTNKELNRILDRSDFDKNGEKATTELEGVFRTIEVSKT